MPNAPDAGPASLYVPRILQQHLADAPDERAWQQEGTAAFCDVSGFTKLSERLAKKGREGAEQIADAIGHVFEALLEVAYQQGGSLLKFGGDALLLWFEGPGHAVRAVRATVVMRRVLRQVGRIEVPGARVMLKMSQAVHSGSFHFFAVGASHHELLTTGPAWSRLVEMEHDAAGGDIVVSPETASHLPAACVGAAKGHGHLIAREPPGKTTLPLIARPSMAPETIARCLPPAVRAHVTAGGGNAELRPVSIAFLRFEGVDALIAGEGIGAAADALHALVCAVERATEAQDVAFLASDVDQDGGKIIMTAGAPRVTGDDEERMMLALRAIIATPLAIPIRIGANRGSVFAGDIGPFYRRTYTVMGDAINLAARVMAKSAPGHLYATADVLDRSNTLFATTAIEPFMVKGKAKPVQAWDVGVAKGSRTRQSTAAQLPLIGRDAEIVRLQGALDAARGGAGRVVVIGGEAGIGKTRLLEALRAAAGDFRPLQATAEAYTASMPYMVWRELLRELIDVPRDAPESEAGARLREVVHARLPDLVPWLPLLAIALGVQMPMTSEVELLAERNRRPRLHETIEQFMGALLPQPTLLQIEDAQHMDEASAELLAFLATRLDAHPWVIAMTQRPGARAIPLPASSVPIVLEPLGHDQTGKLARLVTEQDPLPLHVLETVVNRSGGNPQFLRDLLRLAVESGGVTGLPDSAEAAAMARIDALPPVDRETVRRAAVLGMAFHPRMLQWFAPSEEIVDTPRLDRLGEVFEADGDGYLRFRRALLRDAAYEGLPFRLRRALHRSVAERMLAEVDSADESSGILSLHYFEAGEYEPAWRYAKTAAARADAAFAYAEAADLYQRALDAGKRLPAIPKRDLGAVYESLGDALRRSAELGKASEAFRAARRMNVDRDPLIGARLLMCQARIDEMFGKYDLSRRWAMRARRTLAGSTDPEALRQVARSDGWYASVLQMQGHPRDAVKWAERTIAEAQAIGDDEALGIGYLVLGTVRGTEGTESAESYYRLSLEAFERAGNLARRPALLSNIGLACQWDGRWDEALEYYTRAQQDSIKMGSNISATIARINIAEILVDRGQWREAEEMLLETLPFWKASKYRYLLALNLFYLGRVDLRLGRFAAALARFTEAKGHFEHIGAADEVPPVETRIAECRLYQGALDEALAQSRGLIERASGSRAAAKLVPLAQRIAAQALWGKGDTDGARAAAQASLRSARDLGSDFETFLTLRVLGAMRAEDATPPSQPGVPDVAALEAGLRIHATPALPSFFA